MKQPVLHVKNIYKYYDQVRAVDGVSFEIYPGQVFTLLGPNGAGKTTTLEIVEGLRRKDKGSIEYFGRTLERIDESIKERIGVSLQNHEYMPFIQVREAVEMMASFFHNPLPVDDLIQTVSLNDKKKHLVDKLSGGQKQRLTIACALVNDPEILFLDEPTTGLDPHGRRNIWDLIRSLKAKGKAIVLTTHYMEEAQILSDQVCIMDHGKIIASGSPLQLIQQLEERSFIECSCDPSKEDLALFQTWDLERAHHQEGKLLIETKALTKTLSLLFDWSKEQGHELANITVRQPNLEDVFLHLTGRSLRE